MKTPLAFHPLARALHWTMALLILTMLFIGVGMVTTVTPKHQWLLTIHKPLGIAILVLALLRLGVRLRFRPPALPADMPALMQWVAHASHWALYVLMIAMPLLGWAMLSAGGYPVMLGRHWQLPPIAPVDAAWFAWLREAHQYVAYLFFLTILGHAGAALYHGLIRRDDVLPSMTIGVRPAQDAEPPIPEVQAPVDDAVDGPAEAAPLPPDKPVQSG